MLAWHDTPWMWLSMVLLGSVSHALLQHADRTVIVVPSPEVAAERAARRR